MDPALLGLPGTIGTPSTKAFAALPACRTVPGAKLSLVAKANLTRGNGKRVGEDSDDSSPPGVEEVLEVKPLAESGGKTLELRVLDAVSLRVSSTLLPQS